MSRSHVKTEFSKVTPSLYLGTNLCCATHGKKLFSLGFQADISLEEERLDDFRKLKLHMWLPVKDHFAPSLMQLFSGTAALTELQERNIKTYVHCKNGHGRGPSLLIAYFIRSGMTYEEAFEFVKAKRPEIHLRSGQIKMLKQFESLTGYKNY